VNRHPLGPAFVEQNVAEARDSLPAASHLGDLDSNRSGTDRMDLCHHTHSNRVENEITGNVQ
jgi:hypothetical protein